MEDIRRVAGQTLIWSQARFSRREYELKLGERLFATFSWGNLFGSVSAAATSAGEWDIIRSGILHRRVTVRDKRSLADIAVLDQPVFGQTAATFTSGYKYDWKDEGLIPSKWAFVDYNGKEAVAFKSKSGLKIQVEVVPGGDDENIPVLVVLGLDMIIRIRDTVSHAAAA